MRFVGAWVDHPMPPLYVDPCFSIDTEAVTVLAPAHAINGKM